MKKILFLILICVIKLNAYEYLISSEYALSQNVTRVFFLTNINGVLSIKYYYPSSGGSNYIDKNQFFNYLNSMQKSINIYYINKDEFSEYLYNDLNFLNDFYIQQPQPILNYFYNEDTFSNNNYVVYDDYELLYNSDGLAVESVVNGQYAGLYDNVTIGQSGNLYNSAGKLVLVNGQEPNFFQKLFTPLWEEIYDKFIDAFIINNIDNVLIALFTLALLFFCVKMASKGMGKKSL